MPKNLQDYVSKIKKPTRIPLRHFSSNSFSSSKKWILSNCKHPRTLSFAIDSNQNINFETNDDNHRHDSATLADIDRFLFENFKSLYIKDNDEEDDNNISEKGNELRDKVVVEKSPGGILFDPPRFNMSPPPDLRDSNRFFVDLGLSRSLMDEARFSITASSEDVAGSSSTSTTTLNDLMLRNSNNEVTLTDDNCIALLRYSPSPYDDFRRSMLQMVEARLRNHDGVDWKFMEELLFCYLNLNEKKSYKFILSAFVDLIVALRRNSNRIPASSRNVRSTRQRRRETRDKGT